MDVTWKKSTFTLATLQQHNFHRSNVDSFSPNLYSFLLSRTFHSQTLSLKRRKWYFPSVHSIHLYKSLSYNNSYPKSSTMCVCTAVYVYIYKYTAKQTNLILEW